MRWQWYRRQSLVKRALFLGLVVATGLMALGFLLLWICTRDCEGLGCIGCIVYLLPGAWPAFLLGDVFEPLGSVAGGILIILLSLAANAAIVAGLILGWRRLRRPRRRKRVR